MLFTQHNIRTQQSESVSIKKKKISRRDWPTVQDVNLSVARNGCYVVGRRQGSIARHFVHSGHKIGKQAMLYCLSHSTKLAFDFNSYLNFMIRYTMSLAQITPHPPYCAALKLL